MIIFVILIFLELVVIAGRTWCHLSNFYHKNYTFFDFVFLGVYFIEQLVFLLLYNLIPRYKELWVSIIVLFAISTSGLDKFTMEARNRRSSKNLARSYRENKELWRAIEDKDSFIENLKKDNLELREFIQVKLKKK